MSSLAIKQEIMMMEEQTQTPQTKARLAILYAQRDAANGLVAAAAQKKQAEADAALAKVAKKLRGGGGGEAKEVHSGQLLACRDCEANYFISDKEQAFFTEKGLTMPTRCYPCRQEKKAERQGPQPMHISCKDCQKDFVHSIGAQHHYEENGWAVPIRCIDCRTVKKMAPFAINCKDCHTDFNFSVGSQIHFKQVGWAAPSRCAGCRKTNKAKVAAEAPAVVATEEEVITIVVEAFTEKPAE
jgi:hypothetical protein